MVLTLRMDHRFSRKQDSTQGSTRKPNGDTHTENEEKVENHNIVVYKKVFFWFCLVFHFYFVFISALNCERFAFFCEKSVNL